MITPEDYFPLASTVEKTFTNLQPSPGDPKSYEHFGIISVNPINGHTIIVFRKGQNHVDNSDCGLIYLRHSTDGGANWSPEIQACPGETGVDQRGAVGGYDSNGRLFVFYGRYVPIGFLNPGWKSMNYRYSNDDGFTWSIEYTLATQAPLQPTNKGFLPNGHIVDVGNNILYQPWYGLDATNNSYSMYLYKSTDGGLTFPNVIIVYSGPIYYGEQSMVNLGGGNFLILARDNTKFSFRQFKSEDNCQTWIDQGDTLFVTSFYQSPPWLSFINYEGVGIVACYFTDRGQKKAFVIFGLAKDLIDIGPSSWNLTTIKDIYNYAPSDWDNGYQSFFLPQNQYKGIGVGFKEVNSANAYPIVQFTNISGMKNVLVALGL